MCLVGIWVLVPSVCNACVRTGEVCDLLWLYEAVSSQGPCRPRIKNRRECSLVSSAEILANYRDDSVVRACEDVLTRFECERK